MASPTNRILEFSPSHEEAVVSRVLVLVHQAVDESFPGIGNAGRQFTKTVFSDGEATEQSRPPVEAFGNDEKTSPGGAHAVPPPPARSPRPPSPPQQVAATPPPTPTSQFSAVPDAHHASSSLAGRSLVSGVASNDPATLSNHSTLTPATSGVAAESTMFGTIEPTDWSMWILLALFIAGLVVLAYAFLA